MTNIRKNMIFTCALGARGICIKSTKTEHKPIYFHSTCKPSTNTADNRAINAIKAHASCDHSERVLLETAGAVFIRGLEAHYMCYAYARDIRGSGIAPLNL